MAVAVLGTALSNVAAADAASRKWHGCGKSSTTAAANLAGVPAVMDADAGLGGVFGQDAPSAIYGPVYRAFCADFDGDGDLDRAAEYACCTVSSPSPIVILRNTGSSFAIAYKKLGNPVFRFRAKGRALVVREPKYSSMDPNCCPSHYRERTLRWTGTRFKTTIRIRRAP